MNKNLIIVDIETSSLCRLTSQMVNIGAVHLDSGEEFFIECLPNMAEYNGYNPESGKINGVTKEAFLARVDERSGRYVSQEYSVTRLEEFCLDKAEKPYLCGANFSGFDAMILHRTKYGNFDMSWPLGHRFLDIGSLGFSVFGEAMGMVKLCEKLEIAPEDVIHTGIGGARKEAECVKALLSILKKQKDADITQNIRSGNFEAVNE